LVQFRTVQLGDGQLQLQRRKACMFQNPESTMPGAVQICRLHANGSEKADPVILHNSMQLAQIQRVLHGIETSTLQRAINEKPSAEESRVVDADECFSLVYNNQYVDFEILPTSTLKGGDLKRWLVWRSVLESMVAPMPPPKAKSLNPQRARGARAAAQAKFKTTNATQHEDVTIDETKVGKDCFFTAVEMGTLPAPFLSPNGGSSAVATEAAVLHGQASSRVLPVNGGFKELSADSGESRYLDLTRFSHASSLVKTTSMDAMRVGAVTCHGCEPNTYSKTAAVSAKTNQDSGCVVYPLAGDEECLFMSVFDGHGELGHRASKYIMRQIVEGLCADGAATLKAEPGKCLERSFVAANDIIASRHFDWGNEGGTTGVGMVVNGLKCTIANCGDSRIVVGVRSKPGGPIKAKDLSVDHTPLLPVEKKRIEAAGGYVAQDDEESEARVWLDRDMTCGLAMSRSLGDLMFKSIGVTAMPEITEHTINRTADEFFVGCSDGVWGVMSSQECVDIIAASMERQPGKKLNSFLAAQEVIAESGRRWKDEEGDYRDDITAIIVALPCFESGSSRSSPKPDNRQGSPRAPPARSGAATSGFSTPTSKTPPRRTKNGQSPRGTGGGGASWGKKLMGRGGRTSSGASSSGDSSVDKGDASTPSKDKKKGTTLRRIVSVKESDPETPSGSKM